jgi:penicillin amidase
MGYSADELQAGFDVLPDDARAMVSGYVAGFNRRIAKVRADTRLLPFEFKALSFLPADWTTSNVLACVVTLQRNFDPEAYDFTQTDNVYLADALFSAYGTICQAAMFQDLRWTNDPDAQTYFSSQSTAAAASRSNTAPEKDQRQGQDGQLRLGGVRQANRLGRPIIYSGPQMGFSVPSIVTEGSIQAAGINISGMTVAGIPGIIIGRTPHHAWSMQVGHAHTTDYYVEHPAL